ELLRDRIVQIVRRDTGQFRTLGVTPKRELLRRAYDPLDEASAAKRTQRKGQRPFRSGEHAEHQIVGEQAYGALLGELRDVRPTGERERVEIDPEDVPDLGLLRPLHLDLAVDAAVADDGRIENIRT